MINSIIFIVLFGCLIGIYFFLNLLWKRHLSILEGNCYKDGTKLEHCLLGFSVCPKCGKIYNFSLEKML